MVTSIYRTNNLARIGVALMSDADARHWGYELSDASGVRVGSVYPVLARLLERGWLSDGWEMSPMPQRPPRRYYKITAEGRVALEQLLREFRGDHRFDGVPGLHSSAP